MRHKHSETTEPELDFLDLLQAMPRLYLVDEVNGTEVESMTTRSSRRPPAFAVKRQTHSTASHGSNNNASYVHRPSTNSAHHSMR